MAEQYGRNRAGGLVGLILLGLGMVFLMGQVFNISLIDFLWPFFVLVPGLLFFVGMVLGGKKAGALAIPGSIVSMVGLLLLYQNTFNHWESWAYAWALVFPTSIGIGLAIYGAWSDIPKLLDRGFKWISAGLIAFVLGGIFFELILGISSNVLPNIVWPGLLILLGIYVLTRNNARSGAANGRRNRSIEKVPVEPMNLPPEPAEPAFEPLDPERGKDK